MNRNLEERSRTLSRGPYSVMTTIISDGTHDPGSSVEQWITFDGINVSIHSRIRSDALMMEASIGETMIQAAFKNTPRGFALDRVHLVLSGGAECSIELSEVPEVGVHEVEVGGQTVRLVRTHPLMNRAELNGQGHGPSVPAAEQTVLCAVPPSKVGVLLPLFLGASIDDLREKARITGFCLVPLYFVTPEIGRAPSGSAYGLFAVHEVLDCRFNTPETFRKTFLYVAQVYGHTTGWTRMWLEVFLNTPYEERAFFAHQPGADRERLVAYFRDLGADRVRARLVDLYYTDRVTARIDPKINHSTHLPDGLSSWEASLLFIGQNLDLMQKALGAGVIFSDLREEVGLVINHLLESMGIRSEFVLVANRYAHRLGQILEQVASFPEPLRECLNGRKWSAKDLSRFFSSQGFDPDAVVDFFESSRRKVESIMSKQGMGFELFQTLMFEESIETQPGTIQISPIANIREFSEESANPVLMEAAGYLQTRLRSLGREDLSERLENDPQTSLILCAQGSAPYLYANELWGIILAAAGEMPEAIFLMAGAEAELEDRRRQPHPRNMVFLGWEPGFRDILGSFHVYPRSLLITRPGLSMLGLALCSGIGPVLGPPDRLVDLQTTDESLAAVVGEVQDERTVAVVQYLLFLRRGGLRDEELCRQIIPIKGANPAATVDALREAIALQPKVRRLIRTGIYPSVRADLIPILTGLLDGEPMAFEEIKARLYAACWRHRETFG